MHRANGAMPTSHEDRRASGDAVFLTSAKPGAEWWVAHVMSRDVSDETAVRAVLRAVAAAASSWLLLQKGSRGVI
jgi:hypothetical protein